MKRIICLLLCAALFCGIGCAGKGTATAQATATENLLPSEDELIATFSKMVADDGYTVEKAEKESQEAFPDGKAMIYFVSHPDLGEDILYIKVERQESGVFAFLLSYVFQSADTSNTSGYYRLMQAMLQATDATIQNDPDAAKERLEKIVLKSEDKASYFENGLGYDFFSYGNNQMKLWVFNESDHDKTETSDEADQSFDTSKTFSFTKEELLDTASQSVADYQVTLVRRDADVATDTALAEIVQDTQPEIYALDHKLGITLGWLLVYETDAGIYRICLVDRSAEGDADAGILWDVSILLIQISDPVLLVSEESSEYLAAGHILLKAVYLDEAEENGILYKQFFEPDYFSIEVA